MGDATKQDLVYKSWKPHNWTYDKIFSASISSKFVVSISLPSVFHSLFFLHSINIWFQDDDGDNAFHIAADTAKMIRESLEWIIVMLRHPDAAVEVRNHRQVMTDYFLV